MQQVHSVVTSTGSTDVLAVLREAYAGTQSVTGTQHCARYLF